MSQCTRVRIQCWRYDEFRDEIKLTSSSAPKEYDGIDDAIGREYDDRLDFQFAQSMRKSQRTRFQFSITDGFLAISVDQSSVRVDLMRIIRKEEIVEILLSNRGFN